MVAIRKRNPNGETAGVRAYEVRAKHKDLPCHVPAIWLIIYIIPSVPITNPTRFAEIIINPLKTPPTAQTWRYHENCPYWLREDDE